MIQPEKGQRTDSRMGAFGQHVAITQIGDAKSDAHRKATTRLPLEYRIFDAGKELTLGQAGDVVRVFLGIEAEANPKFVGFPLTVVTIPKPCFGSVRTYRTDVHSRSPNTKKGRTQDLVETRGELIYLRLSQHRNRSFSALPSCLFGIPEV